MARSSATGSSEVTPTTGTVYEKIVIWAEEGGGLSNNNVQWSFGNGATGNIGITIVEDWELYAISFHADTSTNNSNVTMEVMNYRTGAALLSQSMPNQGVTNNYISVVDGLSVNLVQGDVLGFRTDLEQGAISNARIAAWLRRPMTVVTNVAVT